MNTYALVALTASVITFIIGVVVSIFGPNRNLSKSFGLLSLSILIWQIGCFGESYFIHNKALAYIFDVILYAGAPFAPITYIQTVYIATNRIQKIKKLLILFYFLAFVFLMLNLIEPLRHMFYISDIDLRLGFRYAAIPKIGWYMFFIYWCVSSSFILIGLLEGLFKLVGLEKLRIQYFFFASFFIVLSGYMYFGLIFNLDIPLPQFDNVFGVLYGLTMAYAILRHKLMDIDIVVKTGTYFILLVIVAITPFFLLVNYITNFSSFYLGQYKVILSLVLWTLFVLSSDFIKNYLKKLTDRILFMADYNLEEVTSNISKDLQEITDVKNLIIHFDGLLKTLLKVNTFGIFMLNKNRTSMTFLDTENMDHVLNKKFNKDVVKEFVHIKVNNPLVLALLNAEGNMLFSYDIKGITNEEDQQQILDVFTRTNTKVMIASVGDKVINGIIAIGNKKNGHRVNSKDLQLLSLIVNQGSLVMSKIFEIENNAIIQAQSDFLVKHKKELEEKNRLLEAALTELKLTQDKLVEEQQLVAMGTLAGEVAHDIRNPLSSMNRLISYIFEENAFDKSEKILVNIYKSISQNKITKDELLPSIKYALAHNMEIKDTLVQIQEINTKLRRIANDFLEYSKKSKEVHTENICLNTVINTRISQYKDELVKSEIILKVNLESNKSVQLFEYQILKIFENIMDNAVKAILENEGVSLKEITIHLFDCLGDADKNLLCLEIKDSGIGIDEEQLQKIFKPFYTKRKNLQGTGLGLAIVKKIIEDNKGKIKVESEVGKGTKFCIYLPAF